MVRRNSPLVRQKETHQHLVGHARPSIGHRRGRPDAIVIPASRPASNLDDAIRLAQAVSCILVVFCSRKAKAAELSELIAARRFNQAVVVDLPDGYNHELLSFKSSGLARGDLPDACDNPNGDLGIKRNLGLLLARMVGWERIFFMDDDIRNVTPEDLRSTVAMLGYYRSAGMRVTDFPDNSVICHAHRETGAAQDIFVSGSVLAVDCQQRPGFFPEIYNEDWLFFYDDARSKRLGWSDRNATQLPYDPFDQPQRAERQEFGDVLAEGLYTLLDLGAYAADADRDYWKAFLDARWRFLKNIVDRHRQAPQEKQLKILSAVQMAMICLMQIQPEMCENYVKAWRRDLRDWTERVRLASRVSSVDSALAKLELKATENGRPGRFRSLTTVGERHLRPGILPIPQAAAFDRLQSLWAYRPIRIRQPREASASVAAPPIHHDASGTGLAPEAPPIS